ncbi:MAG: 50S ribosomal protein L29 [Planctomycetota bacterium]
MKFKFKELKKKPVEELHKEEKQLREAIWKLRVKKGVDDLENVHQIRATRKELAQVLTAIQQLSKS